MISVILIICSALHFWGAFYIWRRGFGLPAACFALNAVFMAAFVVYLSFCGHD